MLRLPPRSTRIYTLFPTRLSSDLAVKGETLEEYWDYAARIFDWGQDQTCNLILDDGGDATMFALWGARVEAGEELFTPTNEEEEIRSEEHTSELQSLMRISYAAFCLNKTK